MLMHFFWVIISFFAVLGILESIIGIIEIFSLRRIHSIRSATLRIELFGEEERVNYLLNSLSLMADRMQVGKNEVRLEIVDCGLSAAGRQAVADYCEKNPWVLFTE